MLTHKGNSMIMWVLIFAALTSVLALLRTPLKRALQTKARLMTDYVFWSQPSQDPEQYYRDDSSRSISEVTENKKSTLVEQHNGVVYNYNADSSRQEALAYGVADGSEAMLDVFQEKLQ